MTDTIDTNEGTAFLDPNIRTPEMEMAEMGRGRPGRLPNSTSAAINPANPHLYKEDRWQEVFARLRAEDPVHLNEISTAGRFWNDHQVRRRPRRRW